MNNENNNINMNQGNGENNFTNPPSNTINNSSIEREQIQASRSYKLSPEEKLQEQTFVVPEEKIVQQQAQKPVKSKNFLARLFFIIIVLLSAYTAYTTHNYQTTISYLNSTNSPVTTINDKIQLDINSNIVKDLYNKVKTNIREDVAESELNDSMRLYLAFRQVGMGNFYESNCDEFNNGAMPLFTCNMSTTFTPLAFKKDILEVEYKKLFGVNAQFSHNNIQIGGNCLGGYQYIESRGEYVQGTCNEQFVTTYKVQKELIEATSRQSTITLKEQVRYNASEGEALPDYLKSGTYIYIFKLDNNYNYIYIAKYLEQE